MMTQRIDPTGGGDVGGGGANPGALELATLLATGSAKGTPGINIGGGGGGGGGGAEESLATTVVTCT
jgi:hypothetical protein